MFAHLMSANSSSKLCVLVKQCFFINWAKIRLCPSQIESLAYFPILTPGGTKHQLEPQSNFLMGSQHVRVEFFEII